MLVDINNTALTYIFPRQPDSCEKELTSLTNTTISNIILCYFTDFQLYCKHFKHNIFLKKYAVGIPSSNPSFSRHSVDRLLATIAAS